MSATACLPDEAIWAFVNGMLPIDSVPELEMHLSACSECRGVVAEVATVFASQDPVRLELRSIERETGARSAEEFPPGTRVSRYVISGVIGAGAAGIVYRAYDPQLRRHVALKLLRANKAEDASLRSRLLREAQAMAQLSHPNVVGVFDVGTFEDEVFLVLELVEGSTLAAWLELPHRWDVIVRAFLEAGKGLAAAHAVKLVHRDFKPANVLVSVDGRVRVTDFGLARPLRFVQDSADRIIRAGGDPVGGTVFSGTLTQTGRLAGTPLYMAPEQFASLPAEERSDQFAFCVALYSALYRRHPYLRPSSHVPSLAELVSALKRGKLNQPPDAAIPAAVFRILRRGLAVQPTERFGCMQELLDELTSVLREAARSAAFPRRYRAAAAAIGSILSVAVVLSIARGSNPARPEDELRTTLVATNHLRVPVLETEHSPPPEVDRAPLPPIQIPSSLRKSERAKRSAVLPSRARLPQNQSSAAPKRRSVNDSGGLKQYNDALKDPF